METNELKSRLKALKGTINFETVATQIFNRLIYGDGPGLLVLYGPPHEPPVKGEKKGNKTYLLDVVEALQHGCPAIVKDYVSTELWSLLSRLDKNIYRCININNIMKQFNLEHGATSPRIPIGVTISVALAIAAQANGFEQGSNVVIICDDLHKFMGHNKEANEQFLTELSRVLDSRREMTFLAAARLKGEYLGWDAPSVLGFGHVLNLGWD